MKKTVVVGVAVALLLVGGRWWRNQLRAREHDRQRAWAQMTPEERRTQVLREEIERVAGMPLPSDSALVARARRFEPANEAALELIKKGLGQRALKLIPFAEDAVISIETGTGPVNGRDALIALLTKEEGVAVIEEELIPGVGVDQAHLVLGRGMEADYWIASVRIRTGLVREVRVSERQIGPVHPKEETSRQ